MSQEVLNPASDHSMQGASASSPVEAFPYPTVRSGLEYGSVLLDVRKHDNSIRALTVGVVVLVIMVVFQYKQIKGLNSELKETQQAILDLDEQARTLVSNNNQVVGRLHQLESNLGYMDNKVAYVIETNNEKEQQLQALEEQKLKEQQAREQAAARQKTAEEQSASAWGAFLGGLFR